MEPWYRGAEVVLAPLLRLLFRRDFRGLEHVPREGGCIVVANHVSYSDPLLVALFVHLAGRRCRFLAKSPLFRIPVLKWLLRGTRQIPVFRESANAAEALSAAVAAVAAGECVVVYPEGTVTRDPAYWPMLSKTGVARLALATGAPVVPLAQWGAQRFIGRDGWPRLFPRRRIEMRAGAPVDLSAWAGADRTAKTFREVTEHVMARVTGLLAEIRGEDAPATPFVPVRRQPDPPGGDSRRTA